MYLAANDQGIAASMSKAAEQKLLQAARKRSLTVFANNDNSIKRLP
jgi:hypothetical protein